MKSIKSVFAKPKRKTDQSPEAKLKRRQAGWKAKREGEAFEVTLETAALISRLQLLRIPDGCRQIGGNRLIRVKSPFDYVLRAPRRLAFLDAKSTLELAFYASSIPPHQFNALKIFDGLPQSMDVVSGFIVNFKSAGVVEFFSVAMMKSRVSVKPGDGVLLNAGQTLDLNRIFT